MAGDSENSLRESIGNVFTWRGASFPLARGFKIALGGSWGLLLARVTGIIAIGEIPWLR
jgi:hypothetical protein